MTGAAFWPTTPTKAKKKCAKGKPAAINQKLLQEKKALPFPMFSIWPLSNERGFFRISFPAQTGGWPYKWACNRSWREWWLTKHCPSRHWWLPGYLAGLSPSMMDVCKVSACFHKGEYRIYPCWVLHCCFLPTWSLPRSIFQGRCCWVFSIAFVQIVSDQVELISFCRQVIQYFDGVRNSARLVGNNSRKRWLMSRAICSWPILNSSNVRQASLFHLSSSAPGSVPGGIGSRDLVMIQVFLVKIVEQGRDRTVHVELVYSSSSVVPFDQKSHRDMVEVEK